MNVLIEMRTSRRPDHQLESVVLVVFGKCTMPCVFPLFNNSIHSRISDSAFCTTRHLDLVFEHLRLCTYVRILAGDIDIYTHRARQNTGCIGVRVEYDLNKRLFK